MKENVCNSAAELAWQLADSIAQRLHADRPRPTSPQAVSKTVGITKQDGTAQPERAAGSIGSNAVQKPVSAEKAEAGRAATDQIKASEPYQRSTGTIESTARAAASGNRQVRSPFAAQLATRAPRSGTIAVSHPASIATRCLN